MTSGHPACLKLPSGCHRDSDSGISDRPVDLVRASLNCSLFIGGPFELGGEVSAPVNTRSATEQMRANGTSVGKNR